jgi:RNA polymerase sigma factor for flagellar operon FliA
MDLSVEITKQTGISPTEAQLAEKLGVTIDEVYQTFDNARTQQFLSLHGFGQDTPALANVLASTATKTPDEQIEHNELIEHLAKAIQELDKRQREIILLYYQQHLNMKQIAELFNVTEPRVSQLHAAALFNLFMKLRQYDDAGK